MTTTTNDDKVDKWRAMIEDNTPLNYNPHGTFKKGDCTIKIGLHTNCGYFYSSNGGCNSIECEACNMCEKLKNIPMDEDDEHLEEYLEIFSICGYEFIGWPDLEKDVKKTFSKGGNLSHFCYGKNELDELKNALESGKEPLFPYE